MATRAITIPNSTDVGVWTRIAAGAPGGGRVTKIRVLMPGVPQQGPGAGAFNEAFLSTLRGFKLFRTMGALRRPRARLLAMDGLAWPVVANVTRS